MMPGSDNNGSRCPETLRRYYLDAMGIQVWTLKAPADKATAGDIAVDAAGNSNTVQALVEKTQIAETPLHAPIVNPAAKHVATPAQWAALQVEVAACTKCDLHRSRTQTVFGVGNQNADVLIIGEAPGHDEDEQGEPFVGRAGKLLDAMLQAIELSREQVYIANILKCRPPGNRDPHVDEIAQCQPYLQKQIEMLQPRVIFAIGRIAAQSLLQTDAAVGKLRGSVHDYLGIPMIVSYHPAYLLRKPTEKRKAWQDLQRLRAMLN